MAVVTVSRSYGSTGDQIARRVAEGLGYELVDAALIMKIAESANVSVDKVRFYDERYHSRAVDWLMHFITPRIGKIMLDEGGNFELDHYVSYCTQVVTGLAGKGNIVIVGRGAQFILSEHPSAFHVRIIAPDEMRMDAVAREYGVSRETARDRVHREDAGRRLFIQRCFKGDIDDPIAYHLMVDAGRLGMEVASASIISGVRAFSDTREYVPGVRDRRRGERRKMQRRHGERRGIKTAWTARSMEKAVFQEGRPVRMANKPDRRRSDRRTGERRGSDPSQE